MHIFLIICAAFKNDKIVNVNFRIISDILVSEERQNSVEPPLPLWIHY